MTAHDWDAIQREYRAGQLRHGHSQAHEGERVEPGTSRSQCGAGFAKVCFARCSREPARRGNAQAAIVDAAAAAGLLLILPVLWPCRPVGNVHERQPVADATKRA
jgi:hypothetical protein